MQIYNDYIKKKLMIYTKAFIEIFNKYNKKQVHKIYKIVKLKKYLISTVENSLNLDVYWFYKIFKVL